MRLPHLLCDDHGETFFGSIDVALRLRDFAPPALPFSVSDGQSASQYVFIELPVGWIGKSHPSPKRQVLICLQGSIKITTSTGQIAVIEKGMAVAMSDIAGNGHVSEVTSSEPVYAIIIQ